jgi:hypothetical protein
VPYTTSELPPISGAPYNFPPEFDIKLARYDVQLNQLWEKPLSNNAMPAATTITSHAPFITLTPLSEELMIRALDEQGDELWSSRVDTPDAFVEPLAALHVGDDIVAVCNYRANGRKLEQQILLVYVKPPQILP